MRGLSGQGLSCKFVRIIRYIKGYCNYYKAKSIITFYVIFYGWLLFVNNTFTELGTVVNISHIHSQ